MTFTKKVNVALVDDHTLFRKGMVELVNNFENFNVVWEASNGKEFIKNIRMLSVPDIVLLDMAMPEMDGYETALWIKKKYPEIKILVLSMFDQEGAIIKMLKTGVNGYVLKDADPIELNTALCNIVDKGFYYSDLVSGTMANSIKGSSDEAIKVKLNDKEIQFLELVCSEMTYKEIADKMCLSARTIDGYRDSLFDKLLVKSRVGLVLYAIKNGYTKL